MFALLSNLGEAYASKYTFTPEANWAADYSQSGMSASIHQVCMRPTQLQHARARARTHTHTHTHTYIHTKISLLNYYTVDGPLFFSRRSGNQLHPTTCHGDTCKPLGHGSDIFNFAQVCVYVYPGIFWRACLQQGALCLSAHDPAPGIKCAEASLALRRLVERTLDSRRPWPFCAGVGRVRRMVARE